MESAGIEAEAIAAKEECIRDYEGTAGRNRTRLKGKVEHDGYSQDVKQRGRAGAGRARNRNSSTRCSTLLSVHTSGLRRNDDSYDSTNGGAGRSRCAEREGNPFSERRGIDGF